MRLLILLSAVAFASCGPVASQEESVSRSVIDNFVDCMHSDLGLCLKERALIAAERLRTTRKINIFEGVTLINNGPKEAKSLELSPEPEIRKKQVSEQLWETTSDLLNNSELELSWAGPLDDEESRAIDNVEEGRGKKKEVKKKLKVLVPLLILAKIKAAAILVASIALIAISFFKIMLMLKAAFIVKAISIIKHLIHKKHHEEEHAWVPHHEEHGGHGWDNGWNGGWSRSRNEANNLAYSAYTN